MLAKMINTQLKTLSLKEIQFRICQKWNYLLDRTLASRKFQFKEGKVNFKAPLLKEMNSFLNFNEFSQVPQGFFASFSNREDTKRVILECFPEELEKDLAGAERILWKKIPVFRHKDVSFGSPVCWHLDPFSGKRAPQKFWGDIDFLNFEKTGDHKVIWELNRHQYLLDLGKACWLTGDEKYTAEWMDQVDHWIGSNPPKVGINWASSLEIAFRSISWIWCLLFFWNSALVTHDFLARYLYILHLNGLHIEKNLSYYFSPNTHLTGEALGLVYLGLLFFQTEEGDRWLRKGVSILLDQLEKHVQEDGVYFEQSTYYHRYTTDIYLHLYILMQRNQIPIPPLLTENLQKLLDFLALSQKPDGRTPLFGDDDGGRLLFLSDDEYDDFRSCLSTGAVLFRRGDYKERSGKFSEETLWLLGPAAYESYAGLNTVKPAVSSAAFPVGGYYVMRDSWGKDANYLMVDCGPHGWRKGGHAHSDLLSFVLSVKGKTLLIDPGTFTYTSSQEWRNYFRGSLAHSTVSIDNLSQSEPNGPFSWKRASIPGPCSWITRDQFDFFSGESSIYRYFRDPVSHKREIFFAKKKGVWVFFDKISQDSARDIGIRFHFLSNKVEHQRNYFVVTEGDEPIGKLSFFSSHSVRYAVKDDWWSPVYSIKEPAKTGELGVSSKKVAIVTVIEPMPSSTDWEYSETNHVISLIGKYNFCSQQDNFLINEGTGYEDMAGGLGSDFSWIQRHSSGTETETLTFLNGTRIALNNTFEVRFAGRADCVIVERKQKTFSVKFPRDLAHELELMDKSFSFWLNDRRIQ